MRAHGSSQPSRAVAPAGAGPHLRPVELRPLGEADQDLLTSLEEQEDVWEFVGALLVPLTDQSHHLFVVTEGRTSVGVAGLVRSPALDGRDFELLCAMRSEVQHRGLAKQACQLVLAWAFDTAGFERVIACIDDGNEGARAIAKAIGMNELRPGSPGRTVYVTYRNGRGPDGA
jgi:RimJ/RimL family protein N-acetyltransferase